MKQTFFKKSSGFYYSERDGIFLLVVRIYEFFGEDRVEEKTSLKVEDFESLKKEYFELVNMGKENRTQEDCDLMSRYGKYIRRYENAYDKFGEWYRFFDKGTVNLPEKGKIIGF